MLYAIIAAIILIGDQWLKYWVTVNITLSTGEAALIPGVVKLVNIHNSGAAFGFLSDAAYARWLFLGIAALFIIVIVVVLAKHLFKSRFANWCAVMALAGAVGNCIDRALYGYVVDMFKVEFMDFAVFNVADVFLVVACLAFIIYLIVDLFRGKDDDGEDDDDEDDEDDEENPRRAARRSRTVSDDKYDVSGIETLSFEFPDTATPLVSDDKADESDFWKSFKFELRNGDEDEQPKQQPAAEPKPAVPKQQPAAEPKPAVPNQQPAAEPKPAAPKAKPAPKQQPATEPKPAAPKAKAKSSEYDLESILAEFKDL